MTNITPTKRGFTIVETLVAVTILMIAVVGPLTIVNQALRAAKDANNQMIASNLAQETMELVKNQKDQNTTAGVTWLNGISSPATPCTQTDPKSNLASLACDMQFGTSPDSYQYITCGGSGLNNCQLFKTTTGNTSTSYTHAGPPYVQTPFTRYYYLNPVTGDPTMLYQVLVRVVVSWSSGSGYTNQVQLQDFMTSAPQ